MLGLLFFVYSLLASCSPCPPPSSISETKDAVDSYKTLYLEERKKSDEYLNRIINAEQERDAMKGILSTMGGRRMVQTFFSIHVKPYAVVKNPGTSYTCAEVGTAYEKFLEDENNPVTIALLGQFPNESAQNIALQYHKLYGKISWYDRFLYEALLKTSAIEQFIAFILSLPASLLPTEKDCLEKMVKVFVDFEEDDSDMS
ncbi:uncharacterized protein LOC135845396 [Planococcus citri]|uniref:uncharacterized protein LOC135845396 n=1 Tax=Planococcus citri TaxID=170843 RepID=UPI0031F8FC2C